MCISRAILYHHRLESCLDCNHMTWKKRMTLWDRSRQQLALIRLKWFNTAYTTGTTVSWFLDFDGRFSKGRQDQAITISNCSAQLEKQFSPCPVICLADENGRKHRKQRATLCMLHSHVSSSVAHCPKNGARQRQRVGKVKKRRALPSYKILYLYIHYIFIYIHVYKAKLNFYGIARRIIFSSLSPTPSILAPTKRCAGRFTATSSNHKSTSFLRPYNHSSYSLGLVLFNQLSPLQHQQKRITTTQLPLDL